ncbi:glutamate--tRNA ligase [Halobacteriales archaeon QS_8_69_26]|nr:MAG: glutamate--tRNA ligase [Halobacteriales archaeon QS_8_69_26]
MDQELRERIEREAERHALFNALKHGGDADVGAVMGPLMGENPEFREHADDVPGVVGGVVGRVNDRSPAKQRDRLADLAPEMVAELDSDDEEDEEALPPLPEADEYDQVRMRCAPNPNGPWHLGNARMGAVIGTYRDMYDGWMLCRFDDTDPETKRPDLDAYDRILEDLRYLGFDPDEVIRASDRLETYYDHARELIELGGAYTCSCPPGEFSAMKREGEACNHRDKPEDRVREEFERMVEGGYDPGEMVLRVRTDIDHKNPALRDFVAFRIIDTPHPRQEAADYRCWPMLDFQSGIDDHLTDVTHIIRGIDLQDSAKKQRFVYDYFGWEYPEVIHWGHVQVDAYDVAMSTSTIKELVDAGELDGWDDPRAPTVASLRRRGISGGAITEAMVDLGTSTNNVDLSMSTVYACNRDRVDDDADRLFLVRDGPADGEADGDGSGGSDRDGGDDGDGSDDRAAGGPAVEMTVIGGPEAGEPPVHPDHEDRGRRRIEVGGAVLVEADDVPPNGQRVFLKGYGLVRHTRNAFEYRGMDLEPVREGDVPVVHWVPVDDNRPVTLRTMDGDVAGYAEPGTADYAVDDVVQFERVGFARIDDHDDERTVAYYAHR